MKSKIGIQRILTAACALLVLSSALAGCGLFNYGESGREVALSTPIKVEYKMYQVIKGDIRKTFSGMCTVTSLEVNRYSFEVSGYPLEAMLARTGQRVSAGDVLAKLNVAAAREELEQINDALENGVLNSIQRRLYTYQKETIESVIENSELKSTVDGVVRYINTKYTIGRDPNMTVDPGEIMVVVDPEDLGNAQGIMSVEYSTAQKYTMGVGSPVTVTKSSSAGGEPISFESTIIGSSDYVQFYGDTASVTYFIDLAGAPEGIKVGDRLSVNFEEETKAIGCLKIPTSALYSFEGRNFVYVLDSQGLRRECYVEVGLSDDSFVEIKSGLELGQQIVQY